jgi:hypothetical protein
MKRLLLIALSATSLASAQDPATKKHVRFIPLGELSVWKEDLKDGIRVEREAPKGAMPPSALTYSQGEEVKSIRLTLGSLTDIATFPANAEGMVLKEGEGVGGKDFLKSPMPAAPLSLGVLFRDLESMTWEDPQMKLLPDDAASFPAGQMRFVNVSDKTVVIMIAGSPPFGLAPGKVSMKPVKIGNNSIKVGYVPEGGGSKAIWENDVTVEQGQRVQCFFYKAQGKNPRDAVKFQSKPESAPALK